MLVQRILSLHCQLPALLLSTQTDFNDPESIEQEQDIQRPPLFKTAMQHDFV